jgi:hypothetical protein
VVNLSNCLEGPVERSFAGAMLVLVGHPGCASIARKNQRLAFGIETVSFPCASDFS